MKDIKVYVERPYQWDSYNIYVREGNKAFTNISVTTEEIDEGKCYEPVARLTSQQANAIFQALWEAGLRPNNGESSMAHVEAIKYHLEDMRKLVFNGGS